MDNLNIKEHTASEARENLFDLLRSAGTGAIAHQINLRSGASVVLISKEELEGWMETLDIMSSPEEVKSIQKFNPNEKTVTHKQILKKYGLKNNES